MYGGQGDRDGGGGNPADDQIKRMCCPNPAE